jgi:phospholipid-transporting ATPase
MSGGRVPDGFSLIDHPSVPPAENRYEVRPNDPYVDPYADPYADPYLAPVDSYSGNHSESYLSGAGIAADIEDRDFLDLDTGHRPQRQYGQTGKMSNLYSNMKSRLGFTPSYTEMDLPLTDLSRSKRPTQASVPSPPPPGPPLPPPPEEGTGDYDIRKYWYKILGKKKIDPASLGPRVITLNDPAANHLGYKGNHISTTKYNAFTFVPKFLFEQFSKYANLFFLCTAAIQQVPNVSPTNRYTTIGTLAVVLCVSAVKELVEDVKRSNADKELNNSKVQVLGPNGQFEIRRWIKVQVGDIVRVQSEEPFPADILLLASSEPEGLCYIETANLDGETNLKIKQARGETSHLVSNEDLARLRGRILSERPNSSLYTYEATLELDGAMKVPLAPDQLLLRGATLRNTPWIHGVVVFTGHETKLMRNATAAPIKRTAVEHMINLQIIFLFSILLTLAIISSLGNVIKIKTSAATTWYLMLEGTNLVKQFFADLLTYWILFSNLVPIR